AAPVRRAPPGLRLTPALTFPSGARRWARRTGLPSCVASVARRLGGEGAFSERALALFTRSLGSIGFPQQAGKRLPPPVMAPPASVMASFASRQRLTHALLSA